MNCYSGLIAIFVKKAFDMKKLALTVCALAVCLGMSAQPGECFTDCFVRTFPQRIVSLKIHKPADTRLPFMLFRKLFGFPESFLFRKVHDVLPGIRSPEIVVCDIQFVHSGFTRQYPLVSRASRPSPTMFRRMVQKSSWKSAMIMFTSRSV